MKQHKMKIYDKSKELIREHYNASKSPTPQKGNRGIKKTNTPRLIRNVVRMNKAEQKQLEALGKRLNMNLAELLRYSVLVLADSVK